MRKATEEQWAEIEEFPGYAVSTNGQVMNLRTHTILRPRVNSYGYSRVALRREGRTFDVYVHRLVAKTFLTGWRWGNNVRHRNNNSDDSVDNLRFTGDRRMGTVRKNVRVARRRYIRIVENGKLFRSVEECATFMGSDPSSIYRVLRGERISHKGLTFQYEYEEL